MSVQELSSTTLIACMTEYQRFACFHCVGLLSMARGFLLELRDISLKISEARLLSYRIGPWHVSRTPLQLRQHDLLLQPSQPWSNIVPLSVRTVVKSFHPCTLRGKERDAIRNRAYDCDAKNFTNFDASKTNWDPSRPNGMRRIPGSEAF